MKSIFSLLLTLLLLATLPTAALAHGHGHRARQSYALCDVADCHDTGLHQHDSSWYGRHSMGDGHDYHQQCQLDGCTETAHHTHDGVTCLSGSSQGGGRHSGHCR